MDNSFLKKLFAPKNPGRNETGGGFDIPGYQSGSLYVPPGSSYQIKTGDTFERIAERSGMTVQQIQQANNNMVVPPPKGSFINMPSFLRHNADDVPAGPGANSFTSGPNVNLAEYTANLTKQLQNGNLPASIPYQATKSLVNPQTGKPFTDSDYQAEGYIYNNQRQSWELPGGSAASNPQNATTQNQPAYLQIVNYNGKMIPAWQAELYAKRAARKERERKAAAAAAAAATGATNAGGVPATTLDVQIGGG